MDTKQIIERLEAASGPDYAIDLDIARLQGVTVMQHNIETGGNDEATFHRYTASLDSALSLVPEGWRWKLGYSKHVPCVAELVDYTPKAIGATCGECDSNHAIALCIAALRARQHGGDQHWTALRARANKGEG